MNITPDYLIERKKYRSQLRNWKVGALVLMITIVALIVAKSTKYNINNYPEYIAKVHINNIIVADDVRENILLSLRDDDRVKGMIVHLNTPGGSSSASERLYNIFKSIREKKPVVMVMNDLAASGGYMISLAAEHVVAHNSTITGSIGAIMQGLEVTNLAEKLGISLFNFKSGELKAAPNPLEKLNPETREAMMTVINDIYDYFVDLIVEQRHLQRAEVLKIADGRVYTGRQAYALKLVDEVGTSENAVEWLRKTKNLGTELNVVDVPLKVQSWFERLFNKTVGQCLNSLLPGKQIMLQLP